MNNPSAIALSVVIPVYREVQSLPLLLEGFRSCIPDNISWELIFVNDGNVDNEVYRALEALRAQKPVRVVHLSRNFGQHIAIAAGMKNASGSRVLVMDSDLQYQPSDCFSMYLWAVKNRRSAVISTLAQRRHGWFKGLTSKLHYRLMSLLAVPQRQDQGSVFLVSQHVAQGLLALGDRQRMTIPMIHWLWGDIAYYELPHYDREFGASGYTFFKLIRHALGLTGFSTKPLYLSILCALGFMSFAAILTVYLLVNRLWLDKPYLAGWVSLVLLILTTCSVVLFCLGVIGLYLGNVFEAVIARPLYYVQEPGDERIELFEPERPTRG